MADSLITLADMVKINDVSVRDMGATEIFNDAPVLSQLNAIEASHGTDHKFTKETGAPTVGFRAPGEGRDHSKSDDTVVTVGLKILDCSFHVEAALADSHPKGRDYVVQREANRHLRAGFSHGEKQVFYGTGSGDAGGFPGLADSLNLISNAMVLAAGTPAASQNLTDLWMIRTTSDERFLNTVVGNSGEITIGDSYEQMIDGSNSKKRNCIVTPIEAWASLATESSKAVARMVNIDDSDSKLTDDKLAELFELFDESAPPTHVIMNRRSRRQLQQSRVATTPTGAYVPLPEDWDGIPIVSTKSVGYYTSAVAAS